MLQNSAPAELSLTPDRAPESPEIRKELSTHSRQQVLERDARRLLTSLRPERAHEKLEMLAELNPSSADTQALLAISTVLVGGLGAPKKALIAAQRALDFDMRHGLGLAAMSRAHGAAGNKDKEERFRKSALAIAQSQPKLREEIQNHLDLGIANKRQRTNRDTGEAGAVILVGLVLLGGLFALSNLIGIGATEYDSASWFYFARRASLLLFGVAGLTIYTHSGLSGVPKLLMWNIDPKLLGIAALWGAVFGIVTPSGMLAGGLGIVLIAVILHVVCEEIFFRGLIARVLFDNVPAVQAIILSGLIYGIYHLSFHALWFGGALENSILWASLIGVFVGMPLAWLYHRSASLLTPIVCHLALEIVVLLRNVMGFQLL